MKTPFKILIVIASISVVVAFALAWGTSMYSDWISIMQLVVPIGIFTVGIRIGVRESKQWREELLGKKLIEVSLELHKLLYDMNNHVIQLQSEANLTHNYYSIMDEFVDIYSNYKDLAIDYVAMLDNDDFENTDAHIQSLLSQLVGNYHSFRYSTLDEIEKGLRFRQFIRSDMGRYLLQDICKSFKHMGTLTRATITDMAE